MRYAYSSTIGSARLLREPTNAADAVYNQHSDQWSTPLGDDGFLFYAVVHDPPRLIVPRLITGLSSGT